MLLLYLSVLTETNFERIILPYKSIKDLPDSTKSLTTKQKHKFMEVVNAMLEEGVKEDIAIPTALKEAKKIKKASLDKETMFSKSYILNLIKATISPSINDTPQEILKSTDQMISYEIVYEPDIKDAHEQWMSQDTIIKACENFNKNLADGYVKPNLFHLSNTELFTIEKTWVQPELDVLVEQTGEIIKAGTWVAKLQYHDEDLWNLKKAGIIQGVSIGARGIINEETGEITSVSFDPVEDNSEES